jgi:hypothetical protein
MNTCPCCSDVLLRHVDHGSLYWFCRSCWAEMPSVEEYRARVAIAAPEPVRALSVAQAPPSLVVSPQKRSSLAHYRGVAA